MINRIIYIQYSTPIRSTLIPDRKLYPLNVIKPIDTVNMITIQSHVHVCKSDVDPCVSHNAIQVQTCNHLRCTLVRYGASKMATPFWDCCIRCKIQEIQDSILEKRIESTGYTIGRRLQTIAMISTTVAAESGGPGLSDLSNKLE